MTRVRCLFMAAPHNLARAFGQRFCLIRKYKRAGILYVFPPFITARMGQKIGRRPQTQLCGDALCLIPFSEVLRPDRRSGGSGPDRRPGSRPGGPGRWSHLVLNTQHLGRVIRGHPHGVSHGEAHIHGAPEDAEEVVGRAGDGAVSQAGQIAVQEDLLAAQVVGTVGAAAAGEAVGNQADPLLAEGGVGQPGGGGWEWRPSAMSSTVTLGRSQAAPMTPGARCSSDGMAL